MRQDTLQDKSDGFAAERQILPLQGDDVLARDKTGTSVGSIYLSVVRIRQRQDQYSPVVPMFGDISL